MAQEFHNKITVSAELSVRKKLAARLLELAPPQWDWVRITINDKANHGDDSGKIEFDFYSRNYPKGLEIISGTIPDLTFVCELYDFSFPKLYLLSLRDNIYLDYREEDVEFVEEPEDMKINDELNDLKLDELEAGLVDWLVEEQERLEDENVFVDDLIFLHGEAK